MQMAARGWRESSRAVVVIPLAISEFRSQRVRLAAQIADTPKQVSATRPPTVFSNFDLRVSNSSPRFVPKKSRGLQRRQSALLATPLFREGEQFQ